MLRGQLKEKIKTFIHIGDIPFNGPQHRYTKNRSRTLKWIGSDTEDRFLANNGHPSYGSNDIDYRLNAHGYRTHDFAIKNDSHFNILALGCSFVFGTGLRDNEVFPSLIKSYYETISNRPITLWNLGSEGASNDLILRLLYHAVPVLNPDLVLINFTHLERRDYSNVQGEWFKYIPADGPADGPLARRIDQEISEHFLALTSPWDDILNFYRCFMGVSTFLREIKWYYSITPLEQTNGCKDFLLTDNFAGGLSWLDKARDHIHPGPKSHSTLAANYLELIIRDNTSKATRDR